MAERRFSLGARQLKTRSIEVKVKQSDGPHQFFEITKQERKTGGPLHVLRKSSAPGAARILAPRA
jgi:hypothetical protein